METSSTFTMRLSMFPMIETYVWLVPHASRVFVVASVAAVVVSKPAVEVAPPVRRVKPIEAGLLRVVQVLACSPPHVGITLQRLQASPPPLLSSELSTQRNKAIPSLPPLLSGLM